MLPPLPTPPHEHPHHTPAYTPIVTHTPKHIPPPFSYLCVGHITLIPRLHTSPISVSFSLILTQTPTHITTPRLPPPSHLWGHTHALSMSTPYAYIHTYTHSYARHIPPPHSHSRVEHLTPVPHVHTSPVSVGFLPYPPTPPSILQHHTHPISPISWGRTRTLQILHPFASCQLAGGPEIFCNFCISCVKKPHVG
jgi:hypothetical protein